VTEFAVPDPHSAATVLRTHAADWLAMVARRRSRRAFDGVSAPAEDLAALRNLCAQWQPHPDARVVLVEEPGDDIFTGVVGGYGKVAGAPHALIFIADERASYPDQHLGYTGEAVILEATRLNLATCWVGGFFSAKKVGRIVDLTAGERVLAVSPVGFARTTESMTERVMAGMAGAHHRKPVEQLAPGALDGSWPAWAVAAVETARLAPSAVNRQPTRFRFAEGGLVLFKDSAMETPKVTKRLDIGIAMLHAELAATAHGVEGRWTDLDGDDVARFDPVG
jgi:nitroreductase